jgi:hypothetical protein
MYIEIFVPNNSEETWAFLKKFSLKDGETVVRNQVITQSPAIISATCNAGIVHLQNVKEQSLVRLIDIKGRLVARVSVNQSQIALTDRSHGMYLLQINNNKPVTMKVVIH